ncbi:MAG: bifunctional metallophosphatase/5'-nucleotidase [Clostridiales bacterium]|nr:bifunctional metallophosphatase/5'-nucleotidase [Clostridiales bacterium]
MKRMISLSLALVMLLALIAVPSLAEEPETKTLRIIGTSDLHGKFLPWDYALNAESTSGSVAQLSTAIAQYRDENTLLVDAGDTIQDNSADIFVGSDDVHPMIQAINALGYDVWVTGNHEYNYGMDTVRKTISDVECKALVGNVYDEKGDHIADGYTIIEKDGVRIALIGMVTQNITRWDAQNLAECTVTDPLEETRAIIDQIQGQYDVLVGVFHMGIENEYGVANSGVTDILNACPEFDVMVSSHEHAQIPNMDINGVLVVQNKNMAQTMAVIDLTLEKDGDGWKVVDKTSESINIADYEADPAIVELLGKYDEQARADAEQVIGQLTDGALAPENEIKEIPSAQIEDTALMDLINEVQMYYTGAPVSAAALFTMDANMYPGDIKKCDMSLIYKYTNTLYKLHMNGAQLKKYMEWSVNYYNTFADGDLTISFNPDIRAYNYDMFEGVNYEVNVANEPGSRIENLTWPDGTPVKDEDEFDIAVNNYRATSQLLAPGEIFDEGDLPELLEIDVHGEIGGVRELIGDYIVNVKGGAISPECNNNWKITGNDWDEELHQKAVEMLAAGELTIEASEDGRTPNVKAITVEDVA